MFQEFIKSMFLIFMAEMGDKTQILAMAFATRYNIKKVLLGIFIGSLLNHGLAVVLGAYLSKLIPINTIQIIAGFSFIGFALWTLRSDEEGESEETKGSFGPILTVAIAFFIGELGDKTQLTAITLSADARFPLFVLMGTVTGMVITGTLGILVGSKLGNKVPEFTIKIVSATIFMFFGITKLFSVLPESVLTGMNVTVFLSTLAIWVWLLIKPALLLKRQGKMSPYKEVSQELYEFYNHIHEKVENICLGDSYCGKCQGKACIIGYTKEIIKDIRTGSDNSSEGSISTLNNSLQKTYDKDEIIESLGFTIAFLLNNNNYSEKLESIHRIRQVFEKLLLNESISQFEDLNHYLKAVEAINKLLAVRISRTIEAIVQQDAS